MTVRESVTVIVKAILNITVTVDAKFVVHKRKLIWQKVRVNARKQAHMHVRLL